MLARDSRVVRAVLLLAVVEGRLVDAIGLVLGPLGDEPRAAVTFLDVAGALGTMGTSTVLLEAWYAQYAGQNQCQKQ